MQYHFLTDTQGLVSDCVSVDQGRTFFMLSFCVRLRKMHVHACFACVGACAKANMPTGLSHVGSENLATALLMRPFPQPPNWSLPSITPFP